MEYTINTPSGERLRVRGPIPSLGSTLSVEGRRHRVEDILHMVSRSFFRSETACSTVYVRLVPIT